MGTNIGFFCGKKDTLSLEEFCEEIGLIRISMIVDNELSDDASVEQHCYLSTVAKTELHPFGDPQVRLTDARDPLLFFSRSFYQQPYLVAGHINWANDVAKLAAITKPYYNKLTKWIRQNWKLLPGGGFYIGPEAAILLENGAEMVNFLPNKAIVSIVEI